jgi:hypothetical protein
VTDAKTYRIVGSGAVYETSSGSAAYRSSSRWWYRSWITAERVIGGNPRQDGPDAVMETARQNQPAVRLRRQLAEISDWLAGR